MVSDDIHEAKIYGGLVRDMLESCALDEEED